MKRKFILLTLLAALFTGAFAQTGKTEEIKIKVAFHCANGKALLEQGLIKEEGVSSAMADLDTKVVTIQYDAAKQNKEKLVAAIKKIGYSTDFTQDCKEINKACSHQN
jgi:copper chaperone CopZ